MNFDQTWTIWGVYGKISFPRPANRQKRGVGSKKISIRPKTTKKPWICGRKVEKRGVGSKKFSIRPGIAEQAKNSKRIVVK